MRKTLTYSSFVIASLVVIAAFVTATTYAQLAVAIALYPLLVYFAFKVFPRKAWKAPVITIRLPVKSASNIEAETAKPEIENVGIADIDKRAFLKLIGATGLSFFLFSLLNRKAEALFFGRSAGPETVSLKDTAERKIDPAERQPTDGYRISEIDDSIIAYYGFTNKDGGWFIMREDSDAGSFRYAKGDFNFTSGWTSREVLKYDYFSDVF